MFIQDYVCDRCGFECFSSTPRFVYQLPDGSEMVGNVEACWCGECNTLRAAEYLPDVDWLLKRSELTRVDQLPESIQKSLHLLQQTPEEFIGDWVAEAKMQLGWRRSRQSPAKCLTCSSSNVNLLGFEFAESRQSFLHPDCGGTFAATYATDGLQVWFHVVDSEGNRLSKRKQLWSDEEIEDVT